MLVVLLEYVKRTYSIFLIFGLFLGEDVKAFLPRISYISHTDKIFLTANARAFRSVFRTGVRTNMFLMCVQTKRGALCKQHIVQSIDLYRNGCGDNDLSPQERRSGFKLESDE
jgi:hypothetical protein